MTEIELNKKLRRCISTFDNNLVASIASDCQRVAYEYANSKVEESLSNVYTQKDVEALLFKICKVQGDELTTEKDISIWLKNNTKEVLGKTIPSEQDYKKAMTELAEQLEDMTAAAQKFKVMFEKAERLQRIEDNPPMMPFDRPAEF